MTIRGRFVKRPVEVEAIHFTPEASGWRWNDLTEFFGSKSGDGTWQSTGHYVLIHTLEGDMRADSSDWIIKGIHGEFYPCKPDIFEKLYRRVS